MKSNRLVQEDITNFDAFLFHQENQEFEELGEYLPYQEHKVEIPRLGVRTPQARKRKESLSDLNPGKGKEETILTLLPLLYLHSGKKVNLEQEEAFAEIHIHQALS